MPHYEHTATIIVVRIWGVVGELSAYEGRLTFLLPTLCPVVVEIATISGMFSPPSFSHVCDVLLVVEVVFMGLRERSTLSHRTEVLGCQGIFALFHRRQCQHWLARGSCTSPWSSRCSFWLTYPFVEPCSTFDRVEVFVLLCWPQISF